MLVVKDEVKHLVWWQIKGGTCNFLYDNCTQQGALFYTEKGSEERFELEVKDFINDGGWNQAMLREYIS